MLPTFYFQKGKPLAAAENEATLSKIEQLFQSRPQGLCRLKHFAEISKAVGLPLYSKKAVYEAVCRCSSLSPDAYPDVSFDTFASYWNKMIKEHHDQASRFIFTLSAAENEATLSKIEQLFQSRPQGLCRLKHFAEISKAVGLPLYSKKAVYEAVCRCSSLSPDAYPDVSFDTFASYWNEMIKEHHDQASRFIFTLSVARTGLPSRSYLEREDFQSILMDIALTHPAISFDDDAAIFRQRYVELVITRIFWDCSRAWWTGRITAEHLRKSNLLTTMDRLEGRYSRLPGCFSYEQFLVVYEKFWDLDADHDMELAREDLKCYGKGTITDIVIERIFSSFVCQKKASHHLPQSGAPGNQKKETIGFEEFAAFLLAEEDKRHPTAMEYWFRCLDIDGDGIITLYEMELFYKAMVENMIRENFEPLDFSEVAIQLCDYVAHDGCNFTLGDIKRCGLGHRFFNTLVSRTKYLHREMNEQELSKVKINGEKEPSDWEQFCAVEFQLLSKKRLDEQMEELEEQVEELEEQLDDLDIEDVGRVLVL